MTMKVHAALSIAAMTIVFGTVAHAQPISVPREKVLVSYGTVKTVDIPVKPATQGPGIVFGQPVREANATSLRLHFTVNSGAGKPFWSVAVIGDDGRRWMYAPASAEDTEFWSDEIPGDHVTVQLESTVAAPEADLTIDRIAVGAKPTVPRAIVMPDDREPWAKQVEPIVTLGRSVMRLRFVDDDDHAVYVCTGFLVFTSRHVLTNNHCIATDAEMRSALADLDYNSPSAPARSVRFRRLLMHDARLDFSLLELSEPLDRAPLAIGTAVAAKQALLVIQHPGGEPKQVSRIDCAVGATPVAGTTDDRTDFEHRCDTLGGSSGSPVLEPSGYKVVGLHHLGYYPGDRLVNRAVQIQQVVEAIAKRFPELAASAGTH